MGHVGVWNEAAEKVLWAVVVSWLGTLRVTCPLHQPGQMCWWSRRRLTPWLAGTCTH